LRWGWLHYLLSEGFFGTKPAEECIKRCGPPRGVGFGPPARRAGVLKEEHGLKRNCHRFCGASFRDGACGGRHRRCGPPLGRGFGPPGSKDRNFKRRNGQKKVAFVLLCCLFGTEPAEEGIEDAGLKRGGGFGPPARRVGFASGGQLYINAPAYYVLYLRSLGDRVADSDGCLRGMLAGLKRGRGFGPRAPREPDSSEPARQETNV